MEEYLIFKNELPKLDRNILMLLLNFKSEFNKLSEYQEQIKKLPYINYYMTMVYTMADYNVLCREKSIQTLLFEYKHWLAKLCLKKEFLQRVLGIILALKDLYHLNKEDVKDLISIFTIRF